jgi:hypothetical protein
MYVLVTNCTARKRGTAEAVTLTPDLFGPTLRATTANWQRVVKARGKICPAGDLYVGRSITEAQSAATTVGAAPLVFVSAGLGMVRSDDPIPAYDLTPADAGGGLARALAKFAASPVEWWGELSGHGLSRLIRERSSAIFLVALPATYLRMLRDDLSRCRLEDVSRLRLFTSVAGAASIPALLQPSVMPYDERLETVDTFDGTRGDFPQRAMRHFVEVLHGHRLSLEEGRRSVEHALATLGWREVPERKRLDDSQIKSLIADRWDDCSGQSSRLLRALRDEELVACEQGRFASLWREVRSELRSRTVPGSSA